MRTLVLLALLAAPALAQDQKETPKLKAAAMVLPREG
jgi:hypothetical protein